MNLFTLIYDGGTIEDVYNSMLVVSPEMAEEYLDTVTKSINSSETSAGRTAMAVDSIKSINLSFCTPYNVKEGKINYIGDFYIDLVHGGLITLKFGHDWYDLTVKDNFSDLADFDSYLSEYKEYELVNSSSEYKKKPWICPVDRSYVTPKEELLLFAPLKSRKPPPCETCSSMVAEKVFESWSLVTTWMEMSLATSMATG